MALDLRETDSGTTLRVCVRPRASRDALGGERDGALVVRLCAPPFDGAANQALARFLGRMLEIPPTAVRVLKGATGRNKLVSLSGIGEAAARERLLARGAGAPERRE